MMNEPCPKGSILEAALWYDRMEWAVIPVWGKVAAEEWQPYTKERPTESQLREWFGGRYRKANIGVILGPVSGDLACRDFDTQESWEAFRRDRSDLAHTLPTVATSSGGHAYFKAKTRTKTLDDGEIRGEGGYCVLPPSVHESGIIYRWEREPGAIIPNVDPAWFTQETQETELTQETQDTERLRTFVEGVRNSANPSKAVPGTLEGAIQLSLPNGPGYRHHLAFRFARILRAMPAYRDRDPEDLWPEFNEWWKLAEPFVSGIHDRTHCWVDFAEGFPNVHTPWGMGGIPWLRLAEEAKQMEPLKSLERYADSDLHLLANVCSLAQKWVAPRPDFFLGCRDAGAILNKSHVVGNAKLRLLRRHGILLEVEKGTSGPNGKATRWRYLGDASPAA